MFNSQYYTCEQVDERLLQGYVDDFNEVNSTNYSKEELLLKLFQAINWDQVFGKYEESSEFVRVYLDATKKVLWGIRVNGDIYYGAGVPSQIQKFVIDYITPLVEDINLLIDGIEERIGHYVDNQEFVDILLDSTNKILEGHKKNGNKYFGTPVENDVAEFKSEINPEFIEVTTDISGKVINSIDPELEDIHYGGINISEIKRDLDNDTLLTDCDKDGIIYTVENNDSTITLELDDELNLFEIKDSHQSSEIVMEEETGDIYLEQTLKNI